MADRPGSPRARGAGPNLVALGLLAVVGVALLVWQRPWTTDDAPSADGAFPQDPEAALITQLRDVAAAGSAAELADAVGRPADDLWAARRLLDVEDLDLRRVSGASAPDAADGSTSAVVEARWRYGDDSPVGSAGTVADRVRLRLDPDGDRFVIRSVEPVDGGLPLWWSGPLEIERADGVVVVRVGGGGVPDVVARATTARSAVAQVLDVTVPLVVVDTPEVATTAALLGRSPEDLSSLAAISTRLAGTDPLVVLQPDAFAAADDRADQVVLTHEATHVLTDAVGSGAETWVLEGFADYVALRDDTQPLSVSAGQAIAEVRTSGPPAGLPTAEQFADVGPGLGAVYEYAWLVFRFAAADVGEDRVTAFAEAVRTGTPVDDAARSHLGTDVAGLTARWRDGLAALAG